MSWMDGWMGGWGCSYVCLFLNYLPSDIINFTRNKGIPEEKSSGSIQILFSFHHGKEGLLIEHKTMKNSYISQSFFLAIYLSLEVVLVTQTTSSFPTY